MGEMTARRIVMTMGSIMAGLTLIPTDSGASGSNGTVAKTFRMPSPTRQDTTITLPFNGIRLSPPPINASPRISASQAWRAVGVHQTSGSFQLVLARWHSTVPLYFGKRPFFNGLVWLVKGENVKIVSRGGGGTHVGSALWPVNASTGQTSGELTY
jgi:hypothetical protein